MSIKMGYILWNAIIWKSIWYILNKIKCKQSIIKFKWKCLHIIVYSEYRLQKMGKSIGKYICKCHLCKNEIDSLIHLFYKCHKIKHVWGEVNTYLKSFLQRIWYLLKKLNPCGIPVWGRNNRTFFFIGCGNLYIKIGNLENKKLYISLYREAIVITNFKNELRSSIHIED